MITASRKRFFDLPLEIRSTIYRRLFSGLVLGLPQPFFREVKYPTGMSIYKVAMCVSEFHANSPGEGAEVQAVAQATRDGVDAACKNGVEDLVRRPTFS